MSEIFDVTVPIETENGKTIWHKVGTFFRNDDSGKRHIGTIQLMSIPLGAQAPLRLFLYPKREYKKRDRGDHDNKGDDGGFDYGPPPMGDDDVPF